MSISRRRFLRRSGWLTASAVAVPQWLDAAGSAPARPGQKPRHIIHLVSDGMSLGTLTLAETGPSASEVEDVAAYGQGDAAELA
jgi:hypothetical protein